MANIKYCELLTLRKEGKVLRMTTKTDYLWYKQSVRFMLPSYKLAVNYNSLCKLSHAKNKLK